MALAQRTLKAFENLGRVVDEKTEKNLANFVLELCMKQRPKSVTTRGALRWHLFSRSVFCLRIEQITTDP